MILELPITRQRKPLNSSRRLQKRGLKLDTDISLIGIVTPLPGSNSRASDRNKEVPSEGSCVDGEAIHHEK